MLLPNVEYFDLIRLDCEDVKVGLSRECKRLANILLDRVASDHRTCSKEICAAFEEIRERCRKEPTSSEELIEMIRYMEEARCQGMLCREYLKYLLDVYQFSPEDIRLNSEVLTWRKRIYPEFDANDKVSIKLIYA
ncbi:unnamed protein product [Protopolystoma xenopodis]|uniref:Uncharacterized protein n=1 Tax=Protopolystoma xenopodis TaxID=117903 RepID=A0A448WGP2_9PLAT|nr:unnamed protein product [Protopolystoma xenopodis]